MKKNLIVKFSAFILCAITMFSTTTSAKELKNTQINNLVHTSNSHYDPHPIDVELPE